MSSNNANTHTKSGVWTADYAENSLPRRDLSVQLRRPSLRPSDQNITESIAPLENAKLAIQNIPGSLPATPAYEINEMISHPQQLNSTPSPEIEFVDNQPPSPKENMPVQRPPLIRQGSTLHYLGNAITKLIPAKETADHIEAIEVPSGPMTFSNPPKNRWRVAACCLWAISNGFTDGAPGALLPYIEEYYHISYSIVSLIWIATAVGFILVALISTKLYELFDRRTILGLGCFISCVMYTFVLTGYKFPLIVAGFFLNGVGLAIVLSIMNVFLSRLEKSSTALGYFHGCYGIGATVSPLIATQFINHGIKWHFYYLVMLGLMGTNVYFIWWAFTGSTVDLAPWDRLKDGQEYKKATDEQQEQGIVSAPNEESIGLESFGGGHTVTVTPMTPAEDARTNDFDSKTPMKLALRSKLTWLMSAFILFYQGTEVAIGGWIVTFLLDYRKGDPTTVGYVASGYWAGLTVGRLLLTRPMHKHLGARRAIISLALTAIVCITICWVVPSVVVSGIFCSFAGIFIGPTYPLFITLAARILPRKIQVVSLTITTAFGSSGGALFPFFVGLIAQFKGTYVVFPVAIALYGTMLLCWIQLPNIERIEKGEGRLTWWQKIW